MAKVPCRYRKRRHDTEGSAVEAAARVLRQKRKRGIKPLRVYECPHCKGWHLTSWKSMEAPK